MTRRATTRIDVRSVVRALPFLALIVLAAGLSYGYHALLRAQRDRVDHTYLVLTSLDNAFVSIVDAETGQRGYLITGDDGYLAPYREARRETPRMLARLEALVADSAAQTARARALEDLLQAKLEELDASIAARRVQGFDAARTLVAQDRGKALMDDIRATIATIRATETGLLVARSDDARRTEERLLLVTASCAALSIAARIGFAMQRRRTAVA